MTDPNPSPDRAVAKRSLAIGCLASLGGWLALSIGAALLLRFQFGKPLPASIGAALGAGALAWCAIALLRSSASVVREAGLMRRCLAGERPEDGAWVALAGRIEPIGEPLVAPLDGSASVAYVYEIGQHSGSSRNRTYSKHFQGVGLAPAQIHTPAGSFRVLVVPDLEAELPTATLDEQIAAFRAWARTTEFAPREQAADLLLDQWSDADGAFRSDVAYSPIEQVDFARCAFHQQSVRPGSEVALFGRYSAERGGVVPTATPARLVRGDAAALAARLRSKVRTRLVLALLCAAASGAVVLMVAIRG